MPVISAGCGLDRRILACGCTEILALKRSYICFGRGVLRTVSTRLIATRVYERPITRCHRADTESVRSELAQQQGDADHRRCRVSVGHRARLAEMDVPGLA